MGVLTPPPGQEGPTAGVEPTRYPPLVMRTPELFVDSLKALVKVVDGDTLDLDLDLDFYLVLRQRVRLYGLDAPEIRSKDPAEKAKGLESQAFVSDWFSWQGGVLVGKIRGMAM